MKKSFRGRLGDGDMDRIRLSTNDGLTGYRVHKFQLLPIDSNETVEMAIKVLMKQPSSVTEDIDFRDPLLLAAGIVHANADRDWSYPDAVVFDNIIFNQDLWITAKAGSSARDINYHLELERVKLDINEATVATLKDMRGRE